MDEIDLYHIIENKFKNVESEYLTQDNHEEFIEKYLDDIECYDYASGSSKVVLFFNNIKDFVIKMPLNGLDEDHTLSKDYCELESQIYKKAIASNVQDMFARTFFVGMFGKNQDIPIYAAEKVDECCNTDIESKCPKIKAKRTIEKCNNYYNFGSLEVFMSICMQYGVDAFRKLFKFLEVNNINDIRQANVGYRKDGSIVIIDYSGWDEDDDYCYCS